MKPFNNFNGRKKIPHNSKKIKLYLCLFVISIILFSFFYFNLNNNEIFISNNNLITDDANVDDNQNLVPKSSGGLSLFENPFTKNFSFIQNFFLNKYKVEYFGWDIPLYYREGNNDGDITRDVIFSEDNLLLYKSLVKADLTDTETYETYLNLKSTSFWYEENYNEFKYGFMRSYDNTSRTVNDDNRYLIDNLMPIFLLIENIGDNIDDISISGKTPMNSIVEMFNLINSSEFWDEINIGFYPKNSSQTSKYTELNLYAVLANLQIHRIFEELSIQSAISDRAYELANRTMVKIVQKMWDSSLDLGFFYNATNEWNPVGVGTNYKYLHVNALGIITLLEYWIETGMTNDSSYFQKAINLFNEMEKLWVSDNAYAYKADPAWIILESQYDLEANSIMMNACLKLFELTGNITYYNRALEIFDYFESDSGLYDQVNKVYDSSSIDNSKNLHANLKLSETYLKAFEVYESTLIQADFNVSSEIPDFIIAQDIMNLTSKYIFQKQGKYFNPENDSYVSFKIQYEITDVDMHYIFKYPNGTFLKQYEYQITSPDTSHTLLYDITEDLSIGDAYNIYVWANMTKFSMADTLKYFNVKSGLINTIIEGLPKILYQGQIVNVTVGINNTRFEDITVNATLEGEQIKVYPSEVILLNSSEITYVSFNLTAKFGAELGNTKIYFNFMKGDNSYLKIEKTIEIGHSFNYENLIYDSKVVRGDKVSVFMNLINFLTNTSQTIKISFTGEYIVDFISEEYLDEKERKIVSYEISTFENIIYDSIEIKMKISIGNTTYYTKIIPIELLSEYEILSTTFPSKIIQGSSAYFIMIIKNNKETSEGFSLYINGKLVNTNIQILTTGENRIIKKITPTINPYEFGSKSYTFVLKDSSGETIATYYFDLVIELSVLNLVLFYTLPVILPIGLVLYFKNKEIKIKKLRR